MNALDQIKHDLAEAVTARATATATPKITAGSTAQKASRRWLSRWSSAPRWRSRVVMIWVVGLVAATGVAAAAISLAGGSAPPVRLPGGTGLCPSNFPYAAVASQKQVYPSNYPDMALVTRHVTSCFDSTQDAHRAGYRIAPPPPGDTTLGPLYIAPVTVSVQHICTAAQGLTHARVYCPARLPTPWTSQGALPNCPTASCSAPLLSISGTFTAPASYLPSAPGTGDVSIWEGSKTALKQYLPTVYCIGARAHVIARTSFRGHPATWYQCTIFGHPTSTLGWHEGKESYAIAADGPTALRRRLIRYIAAHLTAS